MPNPNSAIPTLFENVIYHGFGALRIMRGFLPGVQDDDLVTVGQALSNALNNSQSFLYMQATTLPAHEVVTQPADYNSIAYGTYTNLGTLTINGTFRVVDWPA
jgi:hypothetical protein